VDHYGDLQYLWAFAPFSMRFACDRAAGRRPDLGTKAITDAMQKMAAWHVQSFTSLPVGDGYEVEVTEFDYKDEDGICYNKNGVTVRHWQRSHTMDGASAYRLDWNGLSFIWTGDGKPDELTTRLPKSSPRTFAIWRSSPTSSLRRLKSTRGFVSGRRI
jgi:ribonuclease Z